MNYWEDFFSLDKLIYPVTGCILMGFFYFIFAYMLKLQFSEVLFYIFMGLGFILGNFIKTNIIKKENIKLNAKKKKKSA